MSTAPNTPKILDRKDIIILSANIECHCGRLKDKTHCPNCGRLRLYGMSETVMAATPDGDIVKDCKVYRCVGCGEKFNDVDWYFKCHAPIKIDWSATKAKAAKELRDRKLKEWTDRIRLGHHFDYNDRQKCKAETGMNLPEIQELMKAAMRYKPRVLTNREKIAACENTIDNLSAYLNDHPDDKETEEEIKRQQELLVKLKEEINARSEKL